MAVLPRPTLKMQSITRFQKGVFVVAAAGNSYCNSQNTIGYPGKYAQVITVGSIGKSAQPSDFSSCGEQLDIAAPGEGVYSTHRNGSYAYLSGTSMATPQVTGIIAKILSRYDIKTQAEMEAYLRKHASDLYNKGFDTRTGYGAPIATNYNEGPDGEPGDPNPDPEPEPDPIISYKKRVVSIPIRAYYDNILFKSNTDGAYRYMSLGGIVVEYTTTKSSVLASEEINRLADSFFSRRGFILPQDQTDLDFTAAWAAYFFKLLLKQEGYEVNISEMWDAEGQSDDRTLVYYTKSYPVGSKVNQKQLVKIRNAKKMERRGQVATLGWDD
ncbi:MAG: S8 family serine peptidase [Saprospiraceae bacterium]|nr:S8 family serine peptidase [Saprospiraceae bacterium]